MSLLVREADGNVRMESGNFQLRFMREAGGAPSQFWQYGSPGPLTYPYAGSGVSVNFETGQDPTQASANGMTPNIISRLDQSGDRFYLREVLFDVFNGVYGIQGHFPDFWLSAEAIDDYIPDYSFLTGWRTKYSPGNFATRLAGLDCPVIFDASTGAVSGIFAVGNEMGSAPSLRTYKDGWIAFKTWISAIGMNSTALVGLMFQKTFPISSSTPSKDVMYNAPGLHLLFNMQGGWALSEGTRTLASGQLSAAQLVRLNASGIQVEVRTHPGMIGMVELYIDNAGTGSTPVSRTIMDTEFTPAEKTWFGLFAQGSAGRAEFFYRQIWDLNAKVISYYAIAPGEKIRSYQTIISNDLKFYRANMPGVFMNKTVFTVPSVGVVNFDGTYQEREGNIELGGVRSVWAGNKQGTLGVLATVKKVDIDGAAGTEAHAGLYKSGANDEMVLALNPFSVNWNTSPQVVRRVTMVTEWATKRV